ncbi:MAG: hypothetical protein HC763_29800 [Hydrococcus sp. CRU_1_1]|nr:hypothetical protein [Hydrococcus sp. CRU_1_1]
MNDQPTKPQTIVYLVMLVSITAGVFMSGTLWWIGGDTVEPTYKCAPDLPIAVCTWAQKNASANVKTVGAISLGFGLISVVCAYFLLQTLSLDDEPNDQPIIDSKPKNATVREYFVYIERSFYIEPGEMVVFKRKPTLGEQTILPSTGERVEVGSLDENIVVKPISNYLLLQAELFERKLPELLPKYKGMYVFF